MEYIVENDFNGVISVSQQSKVQFQKAYGFADNYNIRCSMDLVPLFIDKPMMYPPGEKFQYNNTGYVVLGLIIEKVTGKDFDVYLEENVFKPCKMFDTGYYELDRLPGGCANAYIYDKKRKEYYTNIYSVDVKGTGAGGAFISVLDIEKFWGTLVNNKLLSSQMTNEMLKIHSSTGDEYYGLGVWLRKEKDGTFTPYVEGCDPGVSFISSYNKKTSQSITVISNYGQNVWKMAYEIQQLHNSYV